jgi:hypothetical protein
LFLKQCKQCLHNLMHLKKDLKQYENDIFMGNF